MPPTQFFKCHQCKYNPRLCTRPRAGHPVHVVPPQRVQRVRNLAPRHSPHLVHAHRPAQGRAVVPLRRAPAQCPARLVEEPARLHVDSPVLLLVGERAGEERGAAEEVTELEVLPPGKVVARRVQHARV